MDRQTDRQTDEGGDYNIPFAFLTKCGNKKSTGLNNPCGLLENIL